MNAEDKNSQEISRRYIKLNLKRLLDENNIQIHPSRKSFFVNDEGGFWRNFLLNYRTKLLRDKWIFKKRNVIVCLWVVDDQFPS